MSAELEESLRQALTETIKIARKVALSRDDAEQLHYFEGMLLDTKKKGLALRLTLVAPRLRLAVSPEEIVMLVDEFDDATDDSKVAVIRMVPGQAREWGQALSAIPAD